MQTKILLILSLLLLIEGSIYAKDITNCSVLKYHKSIELKNGFIHTLVNVKIQINNATGDYNSKIQIPYSPKLPVDIVYAQIETPSGQIIRSLKSKDIVKKSNISNYSLYEDDMVYEFELRHNVYPYIINYEYAFTQKNFIEIGDWTPVYRNHLPTQEASLKLTTAINTPLNIWEYQIDKAAIEQTGETITYTWNSSYIPFDEEPYAAHEFDWNPRVTITKETFKYGIEGNLQTWNNFGAWFFNLHKGLDKLTDYEKIKVAELIKGCTTDREKIENLYHHLQRTKRYINVSIDMGGVKSYPAEYVCNNGYGDCKALSNYMKALLTQVGIKSNMVLVNADNKPFQFDLNFPCNRFNHVILCIPYPTDTVWLECTSSYNPAGYLGEFTQNRPALLIEENGGKLIHIPKLEYQDCLVTTKKIINAQDGMSHIYVTLNGPGFEKVKSIESDAPDRWHEYIIDHYLFPSLDASQWKFIASKENIPQINLEIEGRYASGETSSGNVLYYAIPKLVIPQLPENKERKSPLLFPIPINTIDTTIINFPDNFNKLSNTPFSEINSPHARYEKKIELKDNQLTIIRKLQINEGFYDVTDYLQIAKTLNSIKKLDNERIILIQ